MLLQRNSYIDQLIDHKDDGYIKILTGVRRCGKSSIMQLFIEYLLENGISSEQIILYNFESLLFSRDIYTLHKEILSKAVPNRKLYLFFDEIQLVENWQTLINSLRVDLDCDIYITGSNSYLLSSEYSTFIAGRYIQIKVYPLSFKEFLNFKKIRIEKTSSPLEAFQFIAYDQNGNQQNLEILYKSYVTYGGMPSVITKIDSNPNLVIEDTYNSIIIRDVFERGVNSRGINDYALIRSLTTYLADNIGNLTTINKIVSGINTNNNRTSFNTVSNYIELLKNAFVFYETKRFDIKGKQLLNSYGKFYLVDLGFRTFTIGERERDYGFIMENVIYLELLRRGYDVAIGKVGNLEIDFIAKKFNSPKLYIQSSYSVVEQSTFEREIAPLEKVQSTEKLLITFTQSQTDYSHGIKIVNIINWLLDD